MEDGWPIREARILQKTSPGRELGGLLLSPPGGAEWTVFFPARNIHPRPETAFTLDPRDVYTALVLAENLGLRVTGILHTHPHCTSRASEADASGMRLWPTTWLIVSPTSFTCYILRSGRPVETECGPGKPM